jgi:predicted dehydrogenase
MKTGITQEGYPSGRLRLGFLGVGWIGLHRMKSLLDSGLAEATAISDPSEQALENSLKVAPRAALCKDLDSLLREGVDGIVIATPSACHAEQATKALEAGSAVFCQKPLGRNAGETRGVVYTAQRVDRLLSVDFSYRFLSGVRSIRESVRQGEFGEVYGVDLTFHNAYGPDKPWYYQRGEAGGGCLIDLGVHLLDLMMWILDFPEVGVSSSRIFSGGKPLGNRRDCVEDYAVAQLDLGNGAVGRLTCSWGLSAGCDADIRLLFYGTKGGASIHNVGGSFYDFQAERLEGTKRNVIGDPVEWWGRSALEWASRLGRGDRFDPASFGITRVAEIMDDIYDRA